MEEREFCLNFSSILSRVCAHAHTHMYININTNNPKRKEGRNIYKKHCEHQRVLGEVLIFRKHVQKWKKSLESRPNAEGAA